MGEYTVKLDAVNSGTVGIGLKAARLGGMLSSGLPVPSGFVIRSAALEKFMRHNKIANKIASLLDESRSAGMHRIQEISGQIRNMIMNGVMPDFIEKDIKDEYQDLSIGREAKEIGGAALDLIRAGRDNVFVTVRPSPLSPLPSARFSGQMKGIVSVRGHQQITDAIKEVWASLFSVRAILYRKRKRIEDMPSMAIIIQKSIEPEKAGFIYTSIPETRDHSRIVIEGSWGFSESITSGTVTPDEYVIDRETGNLESKKIRKKKWMRRVNEMTGRMTREPVFRERVNAELLEPREISKLMELAMRVEKHFSGHPQEIEWAEERGRLFIIDAEHIPDYGIMKSPGDYAEGEVIANGVCAYNGTARGTARVFNSMSDIERIERGDILVTSMTIPEMITIIENVSGIVTEEGSRSCHAALLAREFGIPCIVCAEGVLSSVRDGEEVILDASGGKLSRMRIQAQDDMQYKAGTQQCVYPSQYAPQQHMQTPPPIQHEGDIKEGHGSTEERSIIPAVLGGDNITATSLKAIITIPDRTDNCRGICEGVGLVRAEHIITETGKHPFYLLRQEPERIISVLVSGIGRIAKEFYPKPVWYRSIDIRSDEFRDLEGGEHEPIENNPIIGWHGIRRSLDQPDLLKIEIEIIERLYKKGLTNIALGIPFLSDLNELRAVKQMAGFPLRIGVMIETPAAALAIEELCKEGIAFAAIGLNDLTQLTLGVDRDNSRISKLYSEMNPAVVRLLKHVLNTCRKYSVETTVYGDFVADPAVAETLVRLGVGSISAEPDNIEDVRAIISRTERKIILENMRGEQER